MLRFIVQALAAMIIIDTTNATLAMIHQTGLLVSSSGG